MVIYANSLTEYDIKFHKLANRLKAKLQLQIIITDKCEFLRVKVTYLGRNKGKWSETKSKENSSSCKIFCITEC